LGGVPIFSSDQYNMYELVSILRCCDRMVSSRFHAVVTSMPGGVVSAGITMDERLANLLHDRGHDHLLLRVDDPELAEKLLLVMRRLDQDADKIRESIACAVVRNLRMMARMGMYLEARVAQRYPNFPIRTGSLSWENYLPPLDPHLQRLAEAHDHSAVARVPAPASLPHPSHAQ
jgi:hypothetical protein